MPNSFTFTDSDYIIRDLIGFDDNQNYYSNAQNDSYRKFTKLEINIQSYQNFCTRSYFLFLGCITKNRNFWRCCSYIGSYRNPIKSTLRIIPAWYLKKCLQISILTNMIESIRSISKAFMWHINGFFFQTFSQFCVSADNDIKKFLEN